MNTKSIIKKAVSENFDRKDDILANIMNNAKRTGSSTHSHPVRLIAVVAAVVLTLTLTVAAIALNRTVTFSLSADKRTVIKGDKVYITATTKNIKDFIDGIYGFTVDVDFDNSRFDFDSDFGIEKVDGIGSAYNAKANLSDDNTVTVLFYSNGESGDFDFLDKDVEKNLWDVFRLRFTVKDDALATVDDSEFVPIDCKIADVNPEGTGFELAENVTLESAVVSVSELQRGDVNGDGSVDIRDLVRFKKYAANSSETAIIFDSIADCDKNDEVEPAPDMICLRKYLLGVIKYF